MADDNAVDMTSDGDDDRGDNLPPTKKYKQSRLVPSVASVDGATSIITDHEGEGLLREVHDSISVHSCARVARDSMNCPPTPPPNMSNVPTPMMTTHCISQVC